MAKLTAYGRHELARVSKTNDAPVSDLVTWERKTRAYMSDGSVLEKLDVRFKPDWLDKAGRFHSFGWKRSGKAKVTVQQWVEIYTKGIRPDGTPMLRKNGTSFTAWVLEPKS